MKQKPGKHFDISFPPPAAANETALHEVALIRAKIRDKAITGTSRGLAPGFVQCNLAILPERYAFDFMLYCQRNQRACPVLEVLDAGNPILKKLAKEADVRTDCARYAIYRDGYRFEDRNDILDLWREDFVTFLIGSGITFDGALEQAGIPTDKFRWVLNTAVPTEPAGCFFGPLTVTMRWLTREHARMAAQITARFPFNHGAPIHVGDPAVLGADLENPLFGGPIPKMPDEFVSVFWACGVTPQTAAERAQLPIFIAHAPAHSFVTDYPAQALRIE